MSKKRRRITPQPKIGTPVMRSLILLFFVAVLLIADLFLLVSHSRSFSETENRVLQQAPELTMNSLTSGKYMTQAEDFITDQFFLRDSWISLKLLLDRASGKVESNDVYLGKDNYLLEKPVEAHSTYLQRNIEAINTFAASLDIPVVMSLIPGAAWICDQKLPTNAPVVNVDEILSDIKNQLQSSVSFVDVTEDLKAHKEEDLYYRSDHHWKSLGAYYAFEAMADSLGIEDKVNDYARMTVTYDFSGTMASNSGASYVKDSIEIYVPLVGVSGSGDAVQSDLALASELDYVVEYVDSAQKSATIYSSEALTQKDKYQVFLGGNHPLINIKTNVDNGRHLLLLKDSYANTFLQFLLPYYNTITVVDPRYYSDNLQKLMENNDITDVLILYYENNFVTDNSLFGVLEDMLEEE